MEEYEKKFISFFSCYVIREKSSIFLLGNNDILIFSIIPIIVWISLIIERINKINLKENV